MKLMQLTRTATYHTAAGVRHSKRYVLKNYSTCFDCLYNTEDRDRMKILALRLQESDIGFLSDLEKDKLRKTFTPTRSEIAEMSRKRKEKTMASLFHQNSHSTPGTRLKCF